MSRTCKAMVCLLLYQLINMPAVLRFLRNATEPAVYVDRIFDVLPVQAARPFLDRLEPGLRA